MPRKARRDMLVYTQSIEDLLWRDIDMLIFKNGYQYPDEKTYGKLLDYIYRRLKRSWFGYRKIKPEDFQRRLRYYYKRKRTELLIVLSYIIAGFYNKKKTPRRLN